MSNEFTSEKTVISSHLRTDVEKVLENRLLQLKAENESCLKTINRLQTQNTSSQHKLELLLTHLNEYATYTTESKVNIGLNSSCEQIETFFSELKSSEKNLNKSSKAIPKTSPDLLTDEFEQEKQKLKQQIHFLCTEQTTLKNALEAAKSQAFSLIQKLSCARNELISAEEEHRKQMSTLASNLEHEKKKFINAEIERNKINNDFLVCKNEFNNLNNYLKSEREKKFYLEEKLNSEIEKCNKLLNENIALNKKLDDMNKNIENEPLVHIVSNKEIEMRSQHLEKENDRLRKHLMKMEEMYTQEVLEFENEKMNLVDQITNLNSKLSNYLTVEEDMKSNSKEKISILTEQIKSLNHERDELKGRIDEAEKTIDQYSSSITNLHAVLEQYEKNVTQLSELERCGRDLKFEQQKNLQLIDRIQHYENDNKLINEQLMKADERLKSMELLNEQIKSLQIIIHEKEEDLNVAQSKLNKLIDDDSVKIDKIIMKNLILGYLHAPSNKKHEAMIIIAKYLDFSLEEINNITEGGGYSDHIKPQHSQKIHSFSELFIDFLEKESQPKHKGVRMISDEDDNQPSPLSRQQSTDNPEQQNLSDISPQHKPLLHFYYEQVPNKEPLHMFLQSLKQNSTPQQADTQIQLCTPANVSTVSKVKTNDDNNLNISAVTLPPPSKTLTQL